MTGVLDTALVPGDVVSAGAGGVLVVVRVDVLDPHPSTCACGALVGVAVTIDGDGHEHARPLRCGGLLPVVERVCAGCEAVACWERWPAATACPVCGLVPVVPRS